MIQSHITGIFRVLFDDTQFVMHDWEDNDYSDQLESLYPTPARDGANAKKGLGVGASHQIRLREYKPPLRCKENEVMVEHEGELWCIFEEAEYGRERGFKLSRGDLHRYGNLKSSTFKTYKGKIID